MPYVNIYFLVIGQTFLWKIRNWETNLLPHILPLSFMCLYVCVCVYVGVYSIETYKLISYMQRKIFNKKESPHSKGVS